MRIRQSLFVASVAGLCLPCAAWAQNDDFVTGIPVHFIDASSGRSGYASRAEGRPFDIVTNLNANGHFAFLAEANGKHILEDMNFAPGPWAAAAIRQITKVDYSVWSNSDADPFKVLLEFYDEDDVNFAGGFPTLHVPSGETVDGMINPTATPLHSEAFGPFAFPGEGFVIFNQVLAGGGFGVPAGDAAIYVRARIVETDGVTPRMTGSGAFFFANNTDRFGTSNLEAGHVNPALPGLSAAAYGRDHDLDGIFEGAAASSATTPAAPTSPDPSRPDRRMLRQEEPAASGRWYWYGYSVAVHGDITASAPACESVSLGADGVWVSDTETIAANGVKWYCVTLASGALDGAYKYIDFDTQGLGDTAMGLFDSSGILVASNDTGGAGDNSQLSFGMGRRPSEGGGVFDGANFKSASRGLPAGGPNVAVAHDAGLPAGTYYIAVATSSIGATFGDGFFASGAGASLTGAFRVRTNISGGTNDPSDPPATTLLTGTDPLVFPGGQSAADALYSPGVNWYDFNLCRDADSSNQVDISVITTNAPGFAVYIFDNSGNLMGSTSGFRPGTSAAMSFGGSNPGLTAGHYYAATAYEYDNSLSDVDVAPNATTDGRWHIRGVMNDGGYDLQVQVAVPWFDCPAVGCIVTCDFNQDGGGDTSDVLDLADAIASGTDPFPGSCIDFNQDGGGDTSDVIDMADAIASGTCP